GSATATISVTPVNDEPELTTTVSNQTFQEGSGHTQAAAVTLFSGTSISTIETGQTITSLTFTVSGLLDGVNEKVVVDGTTFSLTDGTTGTTTGGNSLVYNVLVSSGTATVTLSKVGGIAASDLATVVNGIAYQDTNVDQPSSGTRTVTLTQLVDSGSNVPPNDNTATLSFASSVNVVAVNDAPVNTVPGAQSVDENTNLVFSSTTGNAITISDVDVDGTPAPNNTAQVQLSVANGTLTLGTISNISITGGANGSS